MLSVVTCGDDEEEDPDVVKVNDIVSKFSYLLIYMNEEQNPNGAYAVGWWNPNATVVDAPQMCFWLDGCDFRKL
jgi:hypothetical protein